MIDGVRCGGYKSRVFSTYITGGGSSETMAKLDRQRLCLPEMVDQFHEFEIPPFAHLQCYHRKYPAYNKDNQPFYKYIPSAEELELNENINEQREKEKQEAREEARRRKNERLIGLRPNPDAEIPDENLEENPENIEIDEIEIPDDIALDLVEDMIENVDDDPEVLELLQGLPIPRSRRSRTPRPSKRLLDSFQN